MKKNELYFLIIVFFICYSCKKDKGSFKYETHDYLTVKKYLDTLTGRMQAQFDSTGTYSIPYTDLFNGSKRLVFIGTSHTRDVNHPQFALLAKVFEEVKPQMVFNEGGQIPQELVYPSMDSAILHKGEIGCLKYLSDKSNIKMLNGDLNDQEEFKALQKKIPKDQIYLYMAVERFLNPYKQGRFEPLTFEEAFQKKFITYLEKSNFLLIPEEKTVIYLEKIYKHYLKQDLNLDSLVEIQEYYLTDEGMFGEVGRATKEVRDAALLEKIDKALDTYDRVFVVFGGSHRIAVEPALKQIIEKKRDD